MWRSGVDDVIVKLILLFTQLHHHKARDDVIKKGWAETISQLISKWLKREMNCSFVVVFKNFDHVVIRASPVKIFRIQFVSNFTTLCFFNYWLIEQQ